MPTPTSFMQSPLALARVSAVLLCLLAATLSSCDKKPGTPPAKPEQDHDAGHEAGHEAGHDHDEGHSDEVRLTEAAIERYGVKVQAATKRVLTPTFVCPARVAFNAEAMAHVGSPLRGRAVEIKVRLGDQVKKDQDLVVIESPELGEAQSEFLQKRTAAQSAAPQVDLAKASWDRAKALHEESQGISLAEVQRREAEYKAAVAAQVSAQSAVTAAENRLHLLGMDQAAVRALAQSGEVASRHVIRAPIDGQVVQRELTHGELVGPDREALLVLADTTTLWVLVDVPENRLADIAIGALASISLGLLEGESLDATISFISPIVDPTTRTAQARIDVHQTVGKGLRPGMFARVEITAAPPRGAEPTPVVAVPQEAVQTVEAEPSIFVPVPGEPSTFARRAVTVRPPVGGFVPILAGLAEGELFVVSGSFILKADLGKSSAAHEH